MLMWSSCGDESFVMRGGGSGGSRGDEVRIMEVIMHDGPMGGEFGGRERSCGVEEDR